MNYTFRMHDPRIGRFFAPDPLEPKYPFYSPYQFSGNRLIDMVELEGLETRPLNNNRNQTSYLRNRANRNRQIYGEANARLNYSGQGEYVTNTIMSLRFQINQHRLISQSNMTEFIEKYNLSPSDPSEGVGSESIQPKSFVFFKHFVNFMEDVKSIIQTQQLYNTGLETDSGSAIFVKGTNKYMPTNINSYFKLIGLQSDYESEVKKIVAKTIDSKKTPTVKEKINATINAINILGPSPMELFQNVVKEAIKKGEVKVESTTTVQQPMFKQG